MIIYENFLDKNLFDSLEKNFELNQTQEFEKQILRTHVGTQINYDHINVNSKTLLDLTSFFKQTIKFKFNSIEFQFCVWENNSSLELHYDIMYKYGATLYFNDWKESWGGLFVYYTKSKVKQLICPQKNLLIFNDKSELHGVTKINSPEKRKTIQIWFKD